MRTDEPAGSAPTWTMVPATDLARYKGRVISVYRSRIPTRIVEVSAADDEGVANLVIEWTGATSAIGGLVRHPPGRRETIPVEADEEYPVWVDEPRG